MANRNWSNGGKIFAMHSGATLVECKFVVSATDTAGLGITNLVGPTVQAVYMHTSATPAALNPNPASGTIVVQLQDNYFTGLSAFHGMITSPNSGSDVKIDNSALTAGVAYTITTLGNATTAKWQAIGVPAGITPAVGVAFIAKTDGGAGNTLTSRVQTTATSGSGVASIEIVGGLSALLNPAPSANQGYGASFILQCYDYAGAKVAPAAGSAMHLAFYLNSSSVRVPSTGD